MINNERIRVLTAGLPELDLVASLFNKYRVFYGQSADIEGSRKFIRERIERSESVVFLAVTENNISPLGFIQLYPSFSSVAMNKIWILNDLYVDEAARRRGVARKLMESAKKLALETGAIELTLETTIDNVNAQRLYEAIGYKKDEEHFYYHLSLS
jgi:ribosomal protein S18 acetylase RimI-like enzyme